MSKFKRTLAIFLAGLPYVPAADSNIPKHGITPTSDDFAEPVDLRPSVSMARNLFAAHRSHQSHGSHRSSSGSTTRPAPAPTPTPAPAPHPTPSQRSQPVDPGRPAQVAPLPGQRTPELSRDEKLRLQVMRVQIALTDLGLYSGAIDGIFGNGTKTALKRFQAVKGLPQDGLMNNQTLQALGVTPVQ